MTTIPARAETAWSAYRQSRSILTRNKLVEANRGLALQIAHRMSGQCPEPIEDLAQIALMGLIKAVERYNPTAGAAFSSFAVPYIQGEILHFQRDHWSHLKVPRRAYEEAGKVKNAAIKLESMGRSVSPERIAAAAGMDQQKWQWVREAVQRKQFANLDEMHHLSGDEVDETAHEYELLRSAIARFPRTKRECVQAYWFSGQTVKTIAQRQKLSETAVQKLLDEAIEQLKRQFCGETACQF